MEARTDVEAKKLKVRDATLAAQEERNDLMRIHQQMMFFTSSTDTLDPFGVEYMSIMRKNRARSSLCFDVTNSSPRCYFFRPSPHNLINTQNRRHERLSKKNTSSLIKPLLSLHEICASFIPNSSWLAQSRGYARQTRGYY